MQNFTVLTLLALGILMYIQKIKKLTALMRLPLQIGCTLNEMKKIVRNHNSNVEFEYKPERPGDVMYTKADTQPLANLGWRTEVTISKGLNRCFKGVKND